MISTSGEALISSGFMMKFVQEHYGLNEPEFKGYGPENSKKESNVVCENSSNETKKNFDAPIIEEWVSDDEDEVETTVVVKKKTVIPTAAKIEIYQMFFIIQFRVSS
ncbi:hypothetical protein Tco_1232371 [Tanacetum coccineum]